MHICELKNKNAQYTQTKKEVQIKCQVKRTWMSKQYEKNALSMTNKSKQLEGRFFSRKLTDNVNCTYMLLKLNAFVLPLETVPKLRSIPSSSFIDIDFQELRNSFPMSISVILAGFLYHSSR